MSEQTPERPVDLDVLRADDLLLDALGRGEPGPDDDAIAAVLAAWRADLVDTDGPAEAEEEQDEAPLAEVVPISRATRRPRVRLAVAAAVLAVVAGGTGIAAAQATPGSPLWPISQVMNPGRAAVLDAESAIAAARQAVADGRPADAQRLVDRASSLISRVPDNSQASRLRTELDQVRHLLGTLDVPAAPGTVPGIPGVPGVPVPGTTPAPGTTSTAGGGTAGSGSGSGSGQQGGGQGTPTSGTGGGVQPPPLPVPLPSLPVPTSLPPLPLPTPTLLGH